MSTRNRTMQRLFKNQGVALLLVFCNVAHLTSTTLINYQPFYEYLYRMNSTTELKTVQRFNLRAEVGFVNIAENDSYQEILLVVHEAIFKPVDKSDINGLQTHDMTKWFSFDISRRGEIDKVRYPPNEDEEVVSLKKGFAGMLSAKLLHLDEIKQEQNTNEWKYNTHEFGKEGLHNATYMVTVTPTGFDYRKKRTTLPTRVVNGTSVYEKTIQVHNGLKTIHSVTVEETYTMDFSEKNGFDPFYASKPAQPVSDFKDMELPTIEAKSHDKLQFIEKRHFNADIQRPHILVNDSIHHQFQKCSEIKLKKEEDIERAVSYITGNMTCIKQQPAEGSPDLTRCFQQMVSNMMILPDATLQNITDLYLAGRTRQFHSSDLLTLVDALGALQNPIAQHLLLDRILSKPFSSTELFQRALLAIVSMDVEPLNSIVRTLHGLCLNGKYPNGISLHEESKHRTCLTFGSLIGRLRKHGKEKEASVLIESVHSELGIYDPWLNRQKRSTMSEKEVKEHDLIKVILLETIGNAGMDSSFEYILSHINDSSSQWIKRSGIHALRSFHNADALLELEKIVLEDEEETVRYEAMLQYQAHPLANRDHEHTGYSERDRRSIFEKVLKFKLEAPGVNWQKLLGSRKIGASFGVIMENMLDIEFSLLKGRVDIRVHDEIYTRVHFGVFGINLDYYSARICFKGGAKYGVNIIQEVDIHLFFRHVRDFKNIARKIVRTAKDGVDAIKSVLNNDFSFKNVVDDIIASIQEIPTKVLSLGSKIRQIMEKMSSFNLEKLPPFIQPVKKFVDAVTSLYDRIREDVMTFYNSVIEAIRIVIPHAAEQIFESVQGVIQGLLKIFKDPKTALSDIGKGVILIYASVKQLNDTKNEIMQHTFISDGLQPYWVELTEDTAKIRNLFDDALHSIKSEGRKWVLDEVEDHLAAKITGGKLTLEKIKETIRSELEAEIQQLLDPLFLLKDIGGIYLQKFMNMFDIFNDIKEAFTLFRNGYKAAKSIVNGIFGHKFDKDFPRTKRVSGGGCPGDGFYPSALGGGNTEYKSKGIDVLASTGENLVAPIAGTVVLSDDVNKIIIKGSDDLPEGSELVLTNIELFDLIGRRTQVTAGEVIGKVSKSPCDGYNHIHIAIRRNGGYVDPSHYIADRIIEVPKWKQICDDFKVVYKFQTISSGYVVGLEGQKEENTTENIQVDETLAPTEMDESKRPESIIKDNENGMYSSLSKRNLRRKRFPSLQNIKSTLDILVGNIKEFLQQFSIRRLKLGNIIQFLDELGLKDTKEKMAKLITDIKEAIGSNQCKNPNRMTEQEMQNELFNRGKLSKGTKQQMIKELTAVDKSCPLLSLALPENELLYCTQDEKCLGIECCVTIELFDLLQKTLRFYIRLDLTPLTLTFGVNNWKVSIDTDVLVGEFENVIDTGIEFDFLDGQNIVVKYSIIGTTTELKLSFGIGICNPSSIDDCFVYISLLNNAVFPFPSINSDGTLRINPINVTKYLDEIKTNIAESPSDITEAFVERTLEHVLDSLGIDKSLLLNGHACPRPRNFETSELKSYLEKRGLSTSGSKQELDDQYIRSDLSCRRNNVTLTLPRLHSDVLYYFISDDCMRIDVCLDFNISALKISRTFYAYLELDPCNFTLTMAFEKKERRMFLFEYEWGKEEIIGLTDDISILLAINKNEEKKVFVIDFAIKLDTVDEKVLQGFEIPIPICNTNFTFQGNLKDLAKALGGELSPAIFSMILRQLKIEDIINYGRCTLPPAPTGCHDPLNVPDIVPENMKDILGCVYAENCFGVVCCVEFSLPIPLSSQKIDVTFPVWFELDPCGFSVNYGIGGRTFYEQLLKYNWGSKEVIPIGSKAETDAPIKIKYNVDKISDGFIIDMVVEICLPIVDDERICVPQDGIVLLDQKKMPLCDMNKWIEFANFSLQEWIKSKGEDIHEQLTNAGRDALITHLGLSNLMMETPCDRKRTPYSPAINGWNLMCPLSLARIPNLQKSISCSVPTSCTGIDCCFEIDKIGLSVRAYLEINMCNYVVAVGIETEAYTFSLFSYEWGKTKTITIKNFLRLRYSIKKPTNEKVFIVTLEVAACFEKDGPCLFEKKVLDGTEVPQIGCDTSIDFSNFSISTWMQNNGLVSIAPTHKQWKKVIDFVLEISGFDQFLLDEQCVLNEGMNSTVSNKWKNDLNDIDVTAFSDEAVCKRTSNYTYMQCCIRSEILNRNLSMNFTFDPCTYSLEVNVENINKKIGLLNYDWGARHTLSMSGLWGIRFMVTNIQTERQFSLDLELHLYIDLNGEYDTNVTVIVADDLKVDYPSCPNTSDGLTNPYYGISQDFWKLPKCTTETIYADQADSQGCNGPKEEIKDVCSLNFDCSGITCCATMDFGDAERNLNIEIAVDCNHNMQLRIENKLWERALLDIPEEVSYTVADCIIVDLAVHENRLHYLVYVNVSVCTLSEGVNKCDLNFMIYNQTLAMLQCTERKKREEMDTLYRIEDPEFKVITRELMQKGASADEIQKMFNDLKEDENLRKEMVWQGEALGDADSSTGYSAVMKSLGHNNPQTLKYQHGIFNTSIRVLGGDIILSILGSVSDIVNRGNQLFNVGSGFSNEGLKLLGIQLANMTIGDIEAMLQINKVDPLMIFQLIQDFINLAKALYSELMERLVDRSIEYAFKTFDIILSGTRSFPRRPVAFYRYSLTIPIGGIISLSFGFGVDGYYGVSLGWEGKLIARSAAGIVSPFGALVAYGEAGIGLGPLHAKLRLGGSILDVRFPTRAEIGFYKFPLDVSLVMDLDLTPLRLTLSAVVTIEIDLWLVSFTKTLYRKDIWEYSAPKIKKRAIDVTTKETDATPPELSQIVQISDKVIKMNRNNGKKEQAENKMEKLPRCDVLQHRFRDYTEPEFSISVAAAEDRGLLRYFLDIGTVHGGNNIENKRQLGGPSTVQTTSVDEYPSGQPLFFTLYAENTAGARSRATCTLPTYDTTPPTGRITVDFLTTSNPHVIKASVLVHDDSEISDAFVAIGYGKGIYGDQMKHWNSVDLNKADNVAYDDNPMSHFTNHQDGKLVSPPFQKHKNTYTASECARLCLKKDHCVSFNYDYGASGQCDLLRSIRHYDETLVVSDMFSYFERLGTGHSTEIHYNTFNMSHNFLHFVNVDITNILGYRSELGSFGILTDFTHPEPGYISNAVSNKLTRSDCVNLIPTDRTDFQRFCVGVHSETLNNRVIIDGKGSFTVFNGDRPIHDLKYTRSTNYIAGNWNGIHDDETGVRVYTMSVGNKVCGDQIHPHHDPHKHLSHESQWTNMAIITPTPEYNPFPLSSGKYYLNVRAINQIEYGGPLALTVCHSTPYIIDITKPIIYEIYNIKYDEDSQTLSAEHNSTDQESGLAFIEICLGSNVRNCGISSWIKYSTVPYFEHVVRIPDGVPVWLRLRVTNNVDLHAVAQANGAMTVDASPPYAGSVYDGPLLQEDLKFTQYSNKICGNWVGFFDPESGISNFEVGIGSEPGLTDVHGPWKSTQHEQEHCFLLQDDTLKHDHVYYIIVWAHNAAVKQQNVSSVSNGVRIDLTPPQQGLAVDGNSKDSSDVEFSPSKSDVHLQWNSFYDQESGIQKYDVRTLRKKANGDWDILSDWIDLDNSIRQLSFRNVDLEHNDKVKSIVRATNGALNELEVETDGFVVDLTPPVAEYVNDGDVVHDIEYQFDTSVLVVNFKFDDLESGISHLNIQMYEQSQGSARQIFPENNGDWTELNVSNITRFEQQGLLLTSGRKYTTRIRAVNGAGLVTTQDSNGVVIDDSQPQIRWLNVGVLSGEEEIVDGHVLQSDHYGIKATWRATDPQSGISSVKYSVGSTAGGADILDWTMHDDSISSAYIPCSLEETNQTTRQPLYYITLKVKNGAGAWSDNRTSSPIFVVPADVTGRVSDGSFQEFIGDIDYTTDVHTVGMRFTGFKSHQYGIESYDWAVGTSPGDEDVLPYSNHGIIYSEEEELGLGVTSSGYAQIPISLDQGKTYYTTLRITTAGSVLQATTDGFIGDTSAPVVSLRRISNQHMDNISSTEAIYQYDQTSLAATWQYHEDVMLTEDIEANIESTWVNVGTYPLAQDIYNLTYVNNTPLYEASVAVVPILSGKTNILSVGVTNKAGLTGIEISPPIIFDNTAPVPGEVTCPRFIQGNSAIICLWRGFADKESKILKYRVTFGTKQGFDDIRSAIELSGHTKRISVENLIDEHGEIAYATVTAENTVGLTATAYSAPVVVDVTPPVAGIVVELPSLATFDINSTDKNGRLNSVPCFTKEECLAIDATCSEALTHLGVAWAGFDDPESEIIEYKISVGTSQGGAEVVPLFSVPHNINHFFITNIDIKGRRQLFATVRAINAAQLSTEAHSNGVYISYISQGLPPLHHIGVYDSTKHATGDIQFQTDLSSIEAKWDTSGDPCPVSKYEWSIETTDGTVLQDFINMYTSTHGVNDILELAEGRRYYSLVKVHNMMGYVYTLRSNGVTVNSKPILPGIVYDGNIIGHDLQMLSSRKTATANWEGFGRLRIPTAIGNVQTGNRGLESHLEIEYSHEIVYYEVALGTDRRFHETRDNVVPFTNVGLNTTATFKDLDLLAESAIYHFTVRALSTSNTWATATSDGFEINLNGGVSFGKIEMANFISTNNRIETFWHDFKSNVGMLAYYAAISDHMNVTSEDCKHYVNGGNATEEEIYSTFNIYPVIDNDKNTYLEIEELSLKQNQSYFIWIIGVDKSGECNMTYSYFTVDITPPEEGRITAGPYFDMKLSFTKSINSLPMKWNGFHDEESGVDIFNISLWQKGSCSDYLQDETSVFIDNVQLTRNYTNFTFTNLDLKDATVYIVSIEAINKAGLYSSTKSFPVIYDASVPRAGRVFEGSNVAEDIVWWGYTDHMNGTLLHFPISVDNTCPGKHVEMTESGWRSFEGDSIAEPDDIRWKIQHRTSNIQIDSFNDTCTIKIARASKEEIVYSGAYMRQADLGNGGLYKVSVKAADGEGSAVTGITFWDGDDTELPIYKYQPRKLDEDSCVCCFETNNSACACNCEAFLNNWNQSSLFSETNTSASSGNASNNLNDVKPASQRACGLQIYSGNNPYIVTWCRDLSESENLLFVSSELDYDPSLEYHDYMIDFYLIKEEINPTFCIRIHVDDLQTSEMCGIPSLSRSTTLVLHVWNKNNEIPPLEIFSLWEATGSFRQLILPQSIDALCRYGEPFLGGTIGIMRYEAAIGTYKGANDIVDFQQVSTPCVPCANDCLKLDCDKDCASNTYTVIRFSLEGIHLNSSYEGSLYLTVTAVLGSGAEVSSSSDGFYIDTTPPVFEEDIFFYIDVLKGNFTPARFQGSNNTLKAVWLCIDDRNEIKEYEWAIGTSVGGEDVQTFTSTGIFPVSQNSDLNGILKHNVTYYVSVKCTNEAGITATYTDDKGVTVLLEHPDQTSVAAAAVDAKNFDRPVYPSTAQEALNKTSCGLTWSNSEDANLVRYDFCVGSSHEVIDDIIPCTLVGYNTSGKVEIKHGYLYINDTPYFNISELKVLSKGIYDTYNTDSDNNFQMESGRTIFLYMRLCNKADICSIKFVNSILFTGERSVLLTSDRGNPVNYTLIPVNKRVKRDLTITQLFIELPPGMKPGQSVLVNELSEDELEMNYDSAASTVYSPYIANPFQTSRKTERVLVGRIKTFNNLFTISPVSQEPVPGGIKITFPQESYNTTNEEKLITRITHWNPDIQQWQLSDRTCVRESDTLTHNSKAKTTTVKICDTRGTREDEGNPESYLSKETQFALVSISEALTNEAPKLIGPMEIVINEDTADSRFLFQAVDFEGDDVAFNISKEVGYPFGNVSVEENVFIYIRLCENCYGEAAVEVLVYDIPDTSDIITKQSLYNITVQVLPVNDPPRINVYSLNGDTLLHEDPTEDIMVYQEQEDVVISSVVGIVVSHDVDGSEDLQILFDKGGSHSFEMHDISKEKMIEKTGCKDNICSETSTTWRGVYINFTQLDTTFVGVEKVKLVALDKTGTYSDVITVSVVVMKKNCKHGTCRSNNPDEYTCNNIRRNGNFNLYYTCKCPVSWNGTYCENDVDECNLGLCEKRKTCENTIGSFNCYCQSGDINCVLSETWVFYVLIMTGVLVLAAACCVTVLCVWAKKCLQKDGAGRPRVDDTINRTGVNRQQHGHTYPEEMQLGLLGRSRRRLLWRSDALGSLPGYFITSSPLPREDERRNTGWRHRNSVEIDYSC